MSWLSIFIGGGIGAVSRHAVGLFFISSQVQWGISLVNIIGGFGAGVLMFSGNGPYTFALGVGFLGGFTTFSAFSAESLRLYQNGQSNMALLYISLNLIGSLLACHLGYLSAAKWL